MKPWILVAIVTALLLVVGVPTVAVALAGRDDASATKALTGSGSGHADQPKGHHRGHGHDRAGKVRGHHGPPPWAGGGRGRGAWKKLSADQRSQLADRLDGRADRMHRLATCLRTKVDVSDCRPAHPRHPRAGSRR